jgi:hypothetical protein
LRKSLIRRADAWLVYRRLTQGPIQPLLRYERHKQQLTPQNVADATGLSADLVPAVEKGDRPIMECPGDGLVAWTRLLSINSHDVLQSLYRSLCRPSVATEIAGKEEELSPTAEAQRYFENVKELIAEEEC